MKAIILAAGRGSRLGPLTDEKPKCFTMFENKPLIEWQLEALRSQGIDNIALVRGYLGKTFKYDLEYFENQRWAETNMVYSFKMAGEWLIKETCLVSYSDIVYSQDIVRRLIESPYDLTLSYDPNWRALWEKRFSDPLSDAETFILKEGKLVEIGKKTKSYDNIQGQYMGLFKITPKSWEIISTFLRSLRPDILDQLDMTSLFQRIIEKKLLSIHALPIVDKWYEIDCQSDLHIR